MEITVVVQDLLSHFDQHRQINLRSRPSFLFRIRILSTAIRLWSQLLDQSWPVKAPPGLKYFFAALITVLGEGIYLCGKGDIDGDRINISNDPFMVAIGKRRMEKAIPYNAATHDELEAKLQERARVRSTLKNNVKLKQRSIMVRGMRGGAWNLHRLVTPICNGSFTWSFKGHPNL